VGSRSGLDAEAKRKKSLHCLCRKSNPGFPTRSLVVILSELPHVPVEVGEIRQRQYVCCYKRKQKLSTNICTPNRIRICDPSDRTP
jgi:hypothetical protein